MIRFNLQQTTNTITVNSCNTFISPSGKYTYIQTGTYTDTLQTTQGCDSIIWIYYTNQKTIDTISLKNCDTIISPSGKFTMKFNGTYIDTLTNNKGCDSILFIQFTRDTFSVILSKSNDISCETFVPQPQPSTTPYDTLLPSHPSKIRKSQLSKNADD